MKFQVLKFGHRSQDQNKLPHSIIFTFLKLFSLLIDQQTNSYYIHVVKFECFRKATHS